MNKNSKLFEEFENKPIEEQIKKHEDEYVVNMNPNAIPNLDKMLEDINEIIEYIEDPTMLEIKQNDNKYYEHMVYGKYNSKLPMKIIKLMLEDNRYDHLAKLLDMFDTLNEVKSGKKDIKNEFDNFKDKLNDEFVYKPHGGKEEFEKKINNSKTDKSSKF